MIQVSDRVPHEHIRVTITGRRTDDNTACTMIVTHEYGNTWAIHGLGNPGVRVSAADMVALAEAILERGR